MKTWKNITKSIMTITVTITLGLAAISSITGCTTKEHITTQTTTSKEKTSTSKQPKVEVETDESATDKEKDAYDSARSYYAYDHLSEKGFHEQLEAEGYSDEEIQYALKRLNPDYNKMAVRCAKAYYDSKYAMSAQGLYDSLVDEWEGFTPEQAQYAIDHLGVDYNKAALGKAKTYAYDGMDPDQISSQLEYEQFTPEQIQYAIDNLNK